MADAREKYLEPEDRLALRTEDVYQVDKDVDTLNYSPRLLEIVATFNNSGQPEGWSVQSMVGRSKRGEVALRLFAVVEPVEAQSTDSGSANTPNGIDLNSPTLLSQWRFGPVRFKSRGCLAMTACASVICDMLEGLTFEEALTITPDQVKEAVGGVPWDKLHTPVFAIEAVRGLIGDWIIRQGATFSQIEALLPCDSTDPHCMICEHCSLRACRTDLRIDEILAKAQGQPNQADVACSNVANEKLPFEQNGLPVDACDNSTAPHAATSANCDSFTDQVNGLMASPATCEDNDASEDTLANPTWQPEADQPADDDTTDMDPQLRELLENNALADLFDYVRENSADSLLVTPDMWADLGIIPDFYVPEDFEMFVYEYLEDYRSEHPLTRKSPLEAPSKNDGIAPDKRTSEHGFRSATKAVGMAPSIHEIMKAKRAEANQEAQTAAICAPETEAAISADVTNSVVADSIAETQAIEDAEHAFADAVGANTNDVDDNPFAGLRLPRGYEMVQLENGEWVMAPTPKDRIPDRKPVNCENVVALTGKYTYYLYDRTKMTDTYAHWAFLAAEDNPLVTFADLVREDSRTYPRPMAASSLHNEPFAMSAEAVEQAFADAQQTEGYGDIQRTVASNGDVYYFSTTYLSPRQAEALAEWASVERVANP